MNKEQEEAVRGLKSAVGESLTPILVPIIKLVRRLLQGLTRIINRYNDRRGS